MAKVNVKNFGMEILEISKLDKIWSPEISIYGIPWKVQVCKEGQDAEQTLDVYLYCANQNKSKNWSLWGDVSFKLLPFSDSSNPVERHIDPYVFDASKFGSGSSLIQWDNLFNADNKYVKNDTINLEIKVSAENSKDPKRSRLNFDCRHKCCDNSYFATFHLTVKNVFNLMAVQSPEFTLRGLPWRLQISKMRSSNLGVTLLSNTFSDDEISEITMTMKIKLISLKENVRPIEKCITKEYQYLNSSSAVEVVSWEEMIKSENGFVSNNSITLEIEIEAEKPCGPKLNSKAEVKSIKLECAICLESIDGQKVAGTPCGHLFCLECITKVVKD